ncbi:SagB/ThcOx family dehydrogenase [Mixta tenebrionis]|uniref:SagB/ThcOx family dehydrogenase n=1 Tax=Mixta tenebrionis TaxID=2562439 RepID=A0A506VAN3_9GAMM|nr:SagB/ThcOx family dehydrogenase [Mixta tenebrionis]TPW42797.1 SagB/ThcOx family dehydrogenase [Mixta tenebrionis]
MQEYETALMEITHYSDQDVLDRVKRFHTLSHFTSLVETAGRTYVSAVPAEKLLQFENKEIHFRPGFSPDHHIESEVSVFPARKPSGLYFSDGDIVAFQQVATLLHNAFSPAESAAVRRPYPSAGAQYPLEIFLCRLSDSFTGWPAGANVYHYLPVSRALESAGEADIGSLYKALSGGDPARLGNPHFALVYFMVFEKALFKYRYRGYRMALMEAGAMYQSACMVSDRLGLENRVWSAFTDSYVSKMLNVDIRTATPLIIQFFGKAHD